MKALLTAVATLASFAMQAGPFTIHVTARGFGENVVSLYRYDDPFTLRTVLVARNILGTDGKATLAGEVEGTVEMQLRIGNRIADLYVRDGHVLNVEPSILNTPNSLNGTTRMGLDFTGIDPLDVNALATDVNERIDAFMAEDLATDQAAGMQVVDIQRKDGAERPDSNARPPTLFVTPVLSEAKLDTFELKLRQFYAEVKDPWFAHYLDHSIAGLRFGPQMNERRIFDTYLKGKPVDYDDPEYVRLLRNLFANGLEQVSRYHGDTLQIFAEAENADGLRKLFQRNDLLRDDDRLAELVMMDQLYRNHSARFVVAKQTEGILRNLSTGSRYEEHRKIAGNMRWDLTTMRVGSQLPEVRLEDERGQPVELKDLMTGPVCIMVTAGWCTYCAPELAGLAQLNTEYPGVVKTIVIGLDRSLEEFNAARKIAPKNDLVWLHALAEQDLREQWRLRNLPVFYLLNEDTLARSPAPPPSQSMGALFLQAKVNAENKDKIKVWDD